SRGSATLRPSDPSFRSPRNSCTGTSARLSPPGAPSRTCIGATPGWMTLTAVARGSTSTFTGEGDPTRSTLKGRLGIEPAEGYPRVAAYPAGAPGAARALRSAHGLTRETAEGRNLRRSLGAIPAMAPGSRCTPTAVPTRGSPVVLAAYLPGPNVVEFR